MRIKMYGGNRPLTEKTKKFNKTFKNFLYVDLGMFYAVFVLLAVAMILEIQFIFGAVLSIALPPAIFFVFWRYFNGMNMSYLELKGSNVIAVDYYIFSSRKRMFDANSIGYVKIMSNLDRKLPGRSIGSRYWMFKYAVFYDKNGEYLFKYLLEFEEDYEWIEHLKVARKGELEIIQN